MFEEVPLAGVQRSVPLSWNISSSGAEIREIVGLNSLDQTSRWGLLYHTRQDVPSAKRAERDQESWYALTWTYRREPFPLLALLL